ncbi:hybrid sensor histidine kinase/response regulator [Leptospira kmetyi]|uniref:histidine kinase n=1 Tax=Leptospira kmetyi TaxID=408139 RepID=A0ABX4N8U4_9LEPT|nr:ATP-binding protein [Leptospira kmetyi]PJZ28497.1 histidine kinase [Leptospira kmetyi]
MRNERNTVRSALGFFLFLSLSILSCGQFVYLEKPPKVVQGVLDLGSKWDFDSMGPLSLEGDWGFSWKKLYSDLSEAREKHSAQYANVPDAWNNYPQDENGNGYPSFGYATYEMKILLDEPRSDMAIKMLEASTSYNIYVNGQKVLSSGIVGRTKEESKPLYRPAVSAPIRLDKSNELVIEVSNFAHSKGGVWAKVWIGKHSELSTLRERTIWLDLFITGGLFIGVLYHFSLFSLLRRELSHLFFALIGIVAIVRIVLTGERLLFTLFPDFDFALSYRLEILSVYIGGSILALFIRSIFPNEFDKKAAYGFVFGFSVLSLIVVATELSFYSRTLPVFSLLVFTECIYIVYVLIRAISNQRIGAWIGLMICILLFMIVTNDLLYANMIINTSYFISYGISLFFIAQAFIISKQFAISYYLSQKLSSDLQRSNDRLISLDKLKDEFLATTSHELRTPLQGIIGIADSLKRGAGGELSSFMESQLRMIVSSGQRLANLVNDIQDFSKLKHSDLNLRRIPVDIKQAADFTLELNRVNVDASKLVLLNEIENDFPPLLADEDRLQQILQNLIGNAIKFTETGSVRVSAKVLDDRYAEISVTDTGIGIPYDQQERIFEFFERIHGGDLSVAGGTGLGLTISRALVSLHGGELNVKSAVQKGSRFYFTIPLSKEGKNPSKTNPNSKSKRQSRLTISSKNGSRTNDNGDVSHKTDTGETNLQNSKIRILVVDDEPVNLEVIRNYLSLSNIESVLVKSGNEALEILKTNSDFKAVILDVMMPRMSGLEVAREIRNHFGPLELPILMLSAKNRDADLISALNAGANDYLVKPFDFEQLMNRITNLLDLIQGHKNRIEHENDKREAIHKVRQKINIDLHDHLGAKLIDLKFLSEELLSGKIKPDQNLIEKIHGTVNQSIGMLREQMLKIEDLNLVSENFITGVNLVLLRRYSDAGREIDFQNEEELIQLFESHRDENALMEFFGIINEVATNDLKYGKGISSWKFSLINHEILMEMNSESDYALSNNRTGRGTENLIQRSAKLEGKMEISLLENVYSIRLKIKTNRFLAV